MSWEYQCYKTYENNKSQIGKATANGAILMPLYFISQKVDLEILINERGHFLSAFAIDGVPTLIPVTTKSAGRTSGIEAHPLCDSLRYIAVFPYLLKHKAELPQENARFQNADELDDYLSYFSKSYDDYVKKLSAWCDSPFSNKVVQAIRTYIDSGTLIDDLIANGFEFPEEFSKASKEAWKYFVRFRVAFDDGTESACWEDQSLFESYRNYVESSEKNDGVCYVTGEECVVALNHPKGVLGSTNKNNAKLVSANDTKNYTFRGRFKNAEEAYCFGQKETLMAHYALKWVVENQGRSWGGRMFVAWNVGNGTRLPQPMSFLSLFQDEDELPTTETAYRDRIYKLMNGYEMTFQDSIDKTVVIMSLTAATTGRLSITYYNELLGSDYLNRIQQWYFSLRWYFRGKNGLVCQSPAPLDIVNFAFGTERANKVQADDKFLGSAMQDMFKLIVEGGRLPRHLLDCLAKKCSARLSYGVSWNYEELLSITCAVFKKIKEDNKSMEVKMELDENNHNRSYLMGRLLAICEKVEQTAMPGVERMTNAARYQAAFAQRPMTVWKNLETALQPYYQRLGPGLTGYYKSLISGVVEKLDCSEGLNKPLEPDYLVGYYLQRMSFYQKKDKDKGE